MVRRALRFLLTAALALLGRAALADGKVEVLWLGQSATF